MTPGKMTDLSQADRGTFFTVEAVLSMNVTAIFAGPLFAGTVDCSSSSDSRAMAEFSVGCSAYASKEGKASSNPCCNFL